MLTDPTTVVRAFPGYKLSCSATGTPPIYVSIIRNSTVMVNKTNNAIIGLTKEVNYTCAASSPYGTDAKDFSVIFIGETHLFFKHFPQYSLL